MYLSGKRKGGHEKGRLEGGKKGEIQEIHSDEVLETDGYHGTGVTSTRLRRSKKQCSEAGEGRVDFLGGNRRSGA